MDDKVVSRVMRSAEAAEYLRMDAITLRDLARAGRIPARRMGRGRGRLVFLRDELDRFIDALPQASEYRDGTAA